MRDADYITESAYQAALAEPIELRTGPDLHEDSRALLLQLRARAAHRRVRGDGRAQRRPQGLHDDQPALPAHRDRRDEVDTEPAGRPRLRGRLHQPRERRDSGDDRGRPRQEGDPVQPGGAGGGVSPGSSFKTFVLTEAIRQGINPYTTRYLSAPFHWQPDPNPSPGTWPPTATRTSGRCRSRPRPSAPTTRSMRASRSTWGPRTSSRWRSGWASRPSCCRWRPSASGRTPSRCSRWPRRTQRSRRRASTPSRWRSAGSSWRTAPSTGTPAGASPSASASFPTVSPTRSRGSCRTTSPAVPEPVPTTAIPRRRERRERRTTRPTPGSRATPRRRPPSSGSGTRTPR